MLNVYYFYNSYFYKTGKSGKLGIILRWLLPLLCAVAPTFIIDYYPSSIPALPPEKKALVMMMPGKSPNLLKQNLPKHYSHSI